MASLVDTVLCTYAKRWFLSYVLLVIIIQVAMGWLGVESGPLTVPAMLATHAAIVLTINYTKGAKCLSSEKEKLQKLINLKDAQIQMRS